MKKALAAALFLSTAAWTTPAHALVYTHPDAYALAAQHNKIAILPVDATVVDMRQGKNRATKEELERQAEIYSEDFQHSMYSWFLRMKKRGKLHVEVQDTSETNAILIQNGIETDSDLAAMSKAELAQMLGVDAIFSARTKTATTFSKGGAMVIDLLTDISVPTGEADVTVKLYDGTEGTMLWSFDRTIDNGYSTDPDDTVEWLMKRVSKRFPYKKGRLERNNKL